MYKRNMARNKFRKNERKYWEEHRRQRNKTVGIRKKSLANYLAKNCARKDKRFWSTISPFMTDKKCKKTVAIYLFIACWRPFCHAITRTKCPRALGTLTRPWNVCLSNSAFFNYFLSNHCCSLAAIMSYQRMNEKLSSDVCLLDNHSLATTCLAFWESISYLLPHFTGHVIS